MASLTSMKRSCGLHFMAMRSTGAARKALFAGLQRVGGALMLPIAVLPIAGLLLRLGQPDLIDSATMAATSRSTTSCSAS
jgi:hypothetical protein